MKQFFPSSVFLLSLCIIQACCSAYAQDVDPTPSPTFKCPEEEGLYPNPTDCSKFYQCFNDVAWAGQCPANLYFNPSLKVCDFPEKVDCHQNSNDRSFKLRDEEPTPSPRFNCPTKEGFYPDATECSKFFQCSNFLAWEQKCPGILFFNPAISQCDFPENVDCHQNSVDQLIKLRDVDPTPSPTFKCPEEEGLYPNPTDCSKFYHCFNHVAWAGQCPANLYFNPSLKVCDFPEKVDCHHDFARLVYQAHKKKSSFECPAASGSYPISSYACVADYYMCVDYTPYPLSCPGGLVFDPQIQSCQTLDKATCAQTTVPPTEPTSPKPFECPASSGSFPVSPDACKPDYYMCVDYTPYPQTCPGNLVFDPMIHSCQSVDKASCETTPTPPTKPTTAPTTEPTTVPSTEPTTVPSTEPTTVPPTEPTTTPPTEPTTTPSTEPTTARTTPKSPTTPHPFRCEEGANGTFPKPGHCEQFIICSNGIAYTMYCPAGLFFNPNSLVCDYESVAQCDH